MGECISSRVLISSCTSFFIDAEKENVRKLSLLSSVSLLFLFLFLWSSASPASLLLPLYSSSFLHACGSLLLLFLLFYFYFSSSYVLFQCRAWQAASRARSRSCSAKPHRAESIAQLVVNTMKENSNRKKSITFCCFFFPLP